MTSTDEEKALIQIGRAALSVAKANAAWLRSWGNNDKRIPAEADLREKKRLLADVIESHLGDLGTGSE